MRIRHYARLAWSVLVRRAPIYAQLIVTRRCNLKCGYCHERDSNSPPVPTAELEERIDALHRLRIASISLLGGEPLLHPDISELVRRIRRESLAGIITNGFLLTEPRVRALNDAGLNYMQLSLDAMHPSPDLYIVKSLKSLRGRLEMLRKNAAFTVNVNVVLCSRSAEEFSSLAAAVREIGFPVTLGLVHDANGHAEIQGEPYSTLWETHFQSDSRLPAFERSYGTALLRGETPDWHCRAGRRYLYVDEFGRVQYCAMQRGRLNRSVLDYDEREMRRYGDQRKGCEKGCSIFRSYRSSVVDNQPVQCAVELWRASARRSAFDRRALTAEDGRLVLTDADDGAARLGSAAS